MSYAIQMAGVNMSSFNGSIANVAIGGKRMHLARDIYQLAIWVRKTFDAASRRAGTPWLYENPNWKSDLSYSNESMVNNFWNRKGIVIIYDHWINESEQLRGHIDLWHLNEMRRAKKHYDYFAYAKSVYFMPLPWVILPK